MRACCGMVKGIARCTTIADERVSSVPSTLKH